MKPEKCVHLQAGALPCRQAYTRERGRWGAVVIRQPWNGDGDWSRYIVVKPSQASAVFECGTGDQFRSHVAGLIQGCYGPSAVDGRVSGTGRKTGKQQSKTKARLKVSDLPSFLPSAFESNSLALSLTLLPLLLLLLLQSGLAIASPTNSALACSPMSCRFHALSGQAHWAGKEGQRAGLAHS